MDKKTIKSLIYKAASLLLLAIFLCTSVFIYLQKSFGWFSDNTEVSASGLSVQSSEGLDVRAEFAEPDESLGSAVTPNISRDEENPFVSFANLHPGNKIYVNLELSNYESSIINVTLSLKAPTAEDDFAIITEEGYTYFGAHLRFNDIKVYDSTKQYKDMESKKADSLSGANAYLLTLPDTAKTLADGSIVQDTFSKSTFPFADPTKNVDKLISKTITLPAATDKDNPGKVTLLLEIEFVDNEMVQNPLIDFGAVEGQVCTRMLICTTEEVTN